MSVAADIAERLARLEGRIERQRRGRLEAERLLELKSRELYEANRALRQLASSLELRVKERTEELVEAHRHVVDLVERDPLTGLANRRRFISSAASVMGDCQASGKSAAFVIVDVDRFKETNDTFGHEAGDVVLRHVADAFKAHTRDSDVVARTGGDEFCVIIPGDVGGHSLAAILKRFRLAMQAPVQCGGRVVPVQASMGYAIFPDHGKSLEEVMRHADLALYRSKRAGRGICTAFTSEMSDELAARQNLEKDLREALHGGDLEPWFQPIIDTASGRARGVEALVRWRRRDGTIMTPGSFLHVAEDCGMMQDLFALMLRESLRLAHEHVKRGTLHYLTVNLSPSQFKLDTLARDIATALRDAQFPPGCLALEITEQVLLTDFERARHQLSLLAKRGVNLALDDFGNGYANISYLRALPFHTLKLDRSMTADTESDDRARRIVCGIAALAASLGLKVIAEGVENAEQSRWLRAAGCVLQQGYHFARPMPAAELGAFLESQSASVVRATWSSDAAE